MILQRMNGRNLLLVGSPGSGKTSLAQMLLGITPRALVIDPHEEYETEYRAENFRTAAQIMNELRDEPFTLAYTPTTNAPESEVEELLVVAEYIQRKSIEEGNGEPLAIFIEEATVFSETHDILPQMRRLYNQGRRWGICLVVIAQVDTDIHRVTRRNSQLIVVMRQLSVSTDLKRLVGDADKLEGYNPTISRPENGVHYLTAPPETDVLEWWQTTCTARV